MSENAVKALESLGPHLRDMLAAIHLKADRRPPLANILVVARQLAWRYDPDRRGYVDETAGQIAAATSLSSSQVRRVFPVLDRLGIWVPVHGAHAGRRDYGTRRRPGPQLCAAAHRLQLDISTRQTALDLAGDNQDLSAISRPGGEDLSAISRPGGEDLSAISRNTSARYRATPKEEPKENPQPTAQPTHVATGLARRRRDLVLKAYAQIALTRSNPSNFHAYVAACKRTASAMPELDDYLARFPDAAPSAIAAWLHGEKQSMQYQREVS